jgi:hypothetical protein
LASVWFLGVSFNCFMMSTLVVSKDCLEG